LLQKIFWTLVTILVLVWVVANPTSAGDSVHHWVNGVITFFSHLSA